MGICCNDCVRFCDSVIVIRTIICVQKEEGHQIYDVLFIINQNNRKYIILLLNMLIFNLLINHNKVILERRWIIKNIYIYIYILYIQMYTFINICNSSFFNYNISFRNYKITKY